MANWSKMELRTLLSLHSRGRTEAEIYDQFEGAYTIHEIREQLTENLAHGSRRREAARDDDSLGATQSIFAGQGWTQEELGEDDEEEEGDTLSSQAISGAAGNLVEAGMLEEDDEPQTAPGIENPPPYSDAEDRLIREMKAQGKTSRDIQEALPHRTLRSIETRWRRLRFGRRRAGQSAVPAGSVGAVSAGAPAQSVGQAVVRRLHRYTAAEDQLIIDMRAQGRTHAEIQRLMPHHPVDSVRTHWRHLVLESRVPPQSNVPHLFVMFPIARPLPQLTQTQTETRASSTRAVRVLARRTDIVGKGRERKKSRIVRIRIPRNFHLQTPPPEGEAAPFTDPLFAQPAVQEDVEMEIDREDQPERVHGEHVRQEQSEAAPSPPFPPPSFQPFVQGTIPRLPALSGFYEHAEDPALQSAVELAVESSLMGTFSPVDPRFVPYSMSEVQQGWVTVSYVTNPGHAAPEATAGTGYHSHGPGTLPESFSAISVRLVQGRWQIVGMSFDTPRMGQYTQTNDGQEDQQNSNSMDTDEPA